MERGCFFSHLDRLPNMEALPYPTSSDQLGDIATNLMSCLELGAGKAEKILKSGINGFDRINTEQFLYYYRSLKAKNLAPFTIKKTTDKSYQSDLVSSSIHFCGWKFANPEYWIPPLSSSLNGVKPRYIDNIPVLTFCNFLTRFLPAKPTEKIEILTSPFIHHQEYLINAIDDGDFVAADRYFAFEKSDGQPEHVVFFDLDGHKIDTGQTKFEAWKQFKETNADTVVRLTNLALHHESPDQISLDQIASLYRAFIDLRISRGFSFYPDLAR